MYNKYFFKRRWKFHQWEVEIGREFAKRCNIHSIIDIGCGIGSFLEGFRLSGVDKLLELEKYYQNALDHLVPTVSKYIKYCDCTTDFNYGKFNCSWSVEVAEHIDPTFSDCFINNLVKSSNRIIVLTAAVPGQKGRGHINCREKDFWINNIEKYNAVYSQVEVDKCRQIWSKIEGVPTHIINNLMIFLV